MSQNSGAATTVITLAILGGGVYFMYRTFFVGYDESVYDPTFKYNKAMFDGKDRAGSAHYWRNRLLDPNYHGNEAMRYSPDMIVYAGQHAGQIIIPTH